jgi:hypothetical protein
VIADFRDWILFDGEVGAVPPLWVKFRLCQLFHCTPADLERNDPFELLAMLELYTVYLQETEKKRELYGDR